MRSIDAFEVKGRRVLVRVDFNVPLSHDAKGGIEVADDTRIRSALGTIEELRGRGAKLILAAHLGRPMGRVDPSLSLAPVARRLSELLGVPVALAPAVVGEQVQALAQGLGEGDLLMLENVRFEPGEKDDDPELARALARLAEFYVNDAFGTAHRAEASTSGVAHLLPSAAGRLLEREVSTLTRILERPERPLLAIVGGAKVADKIAVIDRFLELAEEIAIGGAMCFPFLRAQGHEVGASLCSDEDVEHARHALDAAGREGSATLHLPVDLVLGRELSAGTERRELDGLEVPDGWMGLDVGPRTGAEYAALIAAAGTIFWNGPMGAFELEPFAAGTRAVAKAVADAKGLTVVGGGDSAAALARFGLERRVDHLSTGGGATLELIGARPPATLPGVAALDGAGVGG